MAGLIIFLSHGNTNGISIINFLALCVSVTNRNAFCEFLSKSPITQ